MSSPDGLQLNTAAFDAAVVRLAMTSKKAAVEVMKDQARLLFVEVAKVTPPYSGKITGTQAEKQGRTAVARDIYSLYGTPSDAYDAILAKSPAEASAYWFMQAHGRGAEAAGIVRNATGKSLAPFDGGALHGRTQGGRRRRARARREHVFYVSNPEALALYVVGEQEHVWWLASGWEDALRALGARLPYGVGKHDAPGQLRVEVNDKRIVITMENEVSYGGQVRDLERRMQYALEKRTGKLDNKWNHYLRQAAREAGFSKGVRTA